MQTALTLPDNLPSIADAKIPQTYAAAKAALSECSRVDECQTWANKAEALASYAKQAHDDVLRRMAERIHARAIRRCGELLGAIEPAKNQHDAENRASRGAPTSRNDAAKAAGMSRDQKHTALRVANVPEPEFEEAVESPEPPTVTALAERGKKTQIIDLQGRDEKEYALSTQAQGWLRRFAEFTDGVSPAVAVRGAFGHELGEMVSNGEKITFWIERIAEEIKR